MGLDPLIQTEGVTGNINPYVRCRSVISAPSLSSHSQQSLRTCTRTLDQIHHRKLLCARSVGQKTKIPHHLEELLRDVLLQACHEFLLCKCPYGLLTRVLGFSDNGTGILRCYCHLRSFLICTRASSHRPRPASCSATVIQL